MGFACLTLRDENFTNISLLLPLLSCVHKIFCSHSNPFSTDMEMNTNLCKQTKLKLQPEIIKSFYLYVHSTRLNAIGLCAGGGMKSQRFTRKTVCRYILEHLTCSAIILSHLLPLHNHTASTRTHTHTTHVYDKSAKMSTKASHTS